MAKNYPDDFLKFKQIFRKMALKLLFRRFVKYYLKEVI